jgi:hypothetical protein
MRFGDMRLFPLTDGATATVTIRPARGFDCGAGSGREITKTVRGGTVGLILDARGRPLNLPTERNACRAAVTGWVTALGLYR